MNRKIVKYNTFKKIEYMYKIKREWFEKETLGIVVKLN